MLQLKVSKLQKQVREMRKFMRGLVQLQVEQYEPATILIQAWWRGCLVCSYIWNTVMQDSRQHTNLDAMHTIDMRIFN